MHCSSHQTQCIIDPALIVALQPCRKFKRTGKVSPITTYPPIISPFALLMNVSEVGPAVQIKNSAGSDLAFNPSVTIA